MRSYRRDPSSNADSAETIVASHIRLKEESSGVTLSCRLQTRRADLPPDLWFHFPSDLAPWL